MKAVILTLTDGAMDIAGILTSGLPGAAVKDCRTRLSQTVREAWQDFDALIFIMATGIVVRTIAPLLHDKHSDPAVVVCDELGKFAVSLLSGHAGGANRLAGMIAELTGGQAVITTASDVLRRTALDLWARDLRLGTSDSRALTRAMGKLVNRGRVYLHSEVPIPHLPPDIIETTSPEDADILISYHTAQKHKNRCILHPPVLAAGIGCNRGTGAERIGRALADACEKHGLAPASIALLASIDLKKDERGLSEFARMIKLEIVFFSNHELNRVNGVSESDMVLRATGAKGVAEPAAVLAARDGRLIVRKMKWKDVTVAIAMDPSRWWEQAPAPGTS